MQVETYEVEEITGEMGVMAADSEAIELIEKMGLTGQKTLMNQETVTRNPYRMLTQLESNVFRVLFPVQTELTNYNHGPIPLRVLQVAAHAKETGMFTRFQVWHPESARDDDPVLVGLRPDSQYSWMTTNFLLARWGDALPSIDEMAEKAKKIWIARRKPRLIAIKSEIDGDLARLEADAELAFSGGAMKSHAYSVN